MAGITLELNTGQSARNAAELERRVDSLSDELVKSTRATDRLQQSADRLARRFGGLQRRVLGLVGAFVGFSAVSRAARTISQFESSIATLGGVSRATTDELAQLTATARELGGSTRFSASEAAEGLLFLARAGFSVQESIAGIEGTLALAAAAQIDLGRASDVTSNILSQFQLNASEAERVVDSLLNVSNRANTDVLQLSEAFSFGGTTASAFGLSLEETSAALGVLGDVSIQGSRAGTGLQGVLARLASPTKAIRDAINDLGLEVRDVNPEINDLGSILDAFGQTNLNASSALTIFGRIAAGSGLALVNFRDKIAEVTQAQRENQGVAREQARIQSDTLAGSYRELISGVEEFTLVQGDDGLNGVLRTSVDTLGETVRILGGVPGAYRDASDAGRLFTDVVEAAGIALGGLVASRVTRGLDALVLGIRKGDVSMKAFNATLRANPLTAVLTVVTTATSAFFLFGDSLSDTNTRARVLQDTLRSFEPSTKSFARSIVEFRESLSAGDVLGATRAGSSLRANLNSQLRDAQAGLEVARTGSGDGGAVPFEVFRTLGQQIESLRQQAGIGDQPTLLDFVLGSDAEIRQSIRQRIVEIGNDSQTVGEFREGLRRLGIRFGDIATPRDLSDLPNLGFTDTISNARVRAEQQRLLDAATGGLPDSTPIRSGFSSITDAIGLFEFDQVPFEQAVQAYQALAEGLEQVNFALAENVEAEDASTRALKAKIAELEELRDDGDPRARRGGVGGRGAGVLITPQEVSEQENRLNVLIEQYQNAGQVFARSFTDGGRAIVDAFGQGEDALQSFLSALNQSLSQGLIDQFFSLFNQFLLTGLTADLSGGGLGSSAQVGGGTARRFEGGKVGIPDNITINNSFASPNAATAGGDIRYSVQQGLEDLTRASSSRP